MGDIDITLWLDERKYEALSKALSAKGTDIQTEAQALLDRLYEQTLPLSQRQELADRIATEDRQAAERQEAERLRQQRFGAIQVTENGQTAFYLLDVLHRQQAIARYCAVALRDKDAIHDKDFTASAFIIRRPIGREAFEHYCAHPGDGPKVTAIAAVDFDEGSYSMLRDGAWMTYPLKEIAKAANATNRMTNITEDQREGAFLRKLQEIEPLEKPEQDLTQGISRLR